MSPPAVSPASRRVPNVLPFSRLRLRYTSSTALLTQRLGDQGSDFKMAPASRRLRPAAGSSGSCSPGGRSPLCACAVASASPRPKSDRRSSRGTKTWLPVGTGGQAGRALATARLLSSTKIPPNERTSSLVHPPSRPNEMTRGSAGEEKVESPPLSLREVPRTLDGAVWQRH